MPAQIRDKIIKGEFIDINSLLETGQVVSEQQKMSLVNGELVFQQVRKQKIKNIDTKGCLVQDGFNMMSNTG